jgi:hypothetical protein
MLYCGQSCLDFDEPTYWFRPNQLMEMATKVIKTGKTKRFSFPHYAGSGAFVKTQDNLPTSLSR